MTPERWRAVDAVVQAALERDAAERPAFLAQACGADAALRHEVESLLDAAAADSFLEHPVAARLAARPDTPTLAHGPTGGPEHSGMGLPLHSPPMLRLAAALDERYAVEREVGQGGMATVYLARDLRHRRPVAMKVLHPQLSDALGPERFLREIELTAGLQHPHILPLFDSGAVGGLLYYVMPFVEGETLRARLARERQLPVDEAVRLACEVAGALAYAHGRGVVHRDVKPENILLQGGHALVADFGIALAVEHAGGARMTRTGVSLGTPQYMAPEQATGERAIDARVDVYALGAVLYEMLAGDSPFAASSVQAIVTRVLTEAPRPLVPQRPTVPAHVEAAVRTALQKVPADRFTSASDFAAALVNPAFGRAEPEPAAAPPASTPAPPAAPGRPLSPRAIVLLAAGALAIGATGWQLGSTRGQVSALTLGAPAATGQGLVRFVVSPDSDFLLVGAQAISPDGQTVVFAAEGADGARLYARRLGALKVWPLQGTDGGDLPFFSPDGAWVGFHVGGAILKVAIGGGAPVVVTQGAGEGGFAGGSWGEDGTILYATRDPGALYRVPAGGGSPTRVVIQDDTPTLLQPRLLPGGRAALVTVVDDDSPGRIGVVEVATGRLRDLGAGDGARYVAGQLVYAAQNGELYRRAFALDRLEPTGEAERIGGGPDGVTVARADGVALFDVSSDGTLVYRVGAPREGGDGRQNLRLVVADRRGRELAELPARVPWTPRFSPDGGRIAYGAFAPGRDGSDVWITDLATSTTRQLTSDDNDSNDPQWSPDGRSIAYSANGGDGKDVVVQALDGGPARRFARPGVQWPSDWLRDGRALLVTDRGNTGGEDLSVQPVDGTAARAYLESGAQELGARVSPDGRWVAYRSNESGRDEVYVDAYPTPGRRTLVSAEGGISPVWGRDGRQLYYWQQDRLMAAQLDARGDGPLAVRDRTLLFRAPYFAGVHAMYDVSPDGTRFAIVASGARAGPLVVALNALGPLAAPRATW
jgi:serine/threonine-protein kinase